MHFARKQPRIACSSNLFHFAQPEAYEGFYEDISLFALSVKRGSGKTGTTEQHSYGYNLCTGSPNSARKAAGWYSPPIATLAF